MRFFDYNDSYIIGFYILCFKSVDTLEKQAATEHYRFASVID